MLPPQGRGGPVVVDTGLVGGHAEHTEERIELDLASVLVVRDAGVGVEAPAHGCFSASSPSSERR